MTGKYTHARDARASPGTAPPTMAVPVPEQLVGLAQALSERVAAQMPQV